MVSRRVGKGPLGCTASGFTEHLGGPHGASPCCGDKAAPEAGDTDRAGKIDPSDCQNPGVAGIVGTRLSRGSRVLVS